MSGGGYGNGYGNGYAGLQPMNPFRPPSFPSNPYSAPYSVPNFQYQAPQFQPSLMPQSPMLAASQGGPVLSPPRPIDGDFSAVGLYPPQPSAPQNPVPSFNFPPQSMGAAPSFGPMNPGPFYSPRQRMNFTG